MPPDITLTLSVQGRPGLPSLKSQCLLWPNVTFLSGSGGYSHCPDLLWEHFSWSRRQTSTLSLGKEEGRRKTKAKVKAKSTVTFGDSEGKQVHQSILPLRLRTQPKLSGQMEVLPLAEATQQERPHHACFPHLCKRPVALALQYVLPVPLRGRPRQHSHRGSLPPKDPWESS